MPYISSTNANQKYNDPKDALLLYLNAKENEKERIISWFLKIFDLFTFNRKYKVKEYIKMCNQVWPAIMYFSGRKIKTLLKFHTNWLEEGNYVEHRQLVEFVMNEKDIQKAK